VPEAFVWNTINSKCLPNFNKFINFFISQGLTFSKEVSSPTSSTAWTLASTRRLRFSSHWCVNWFSKQSAIVGAFSSGWYLRPKGPCLWSVPFYERLHNRPYSLRCDLTVPCFLFSHSFSCLSTGDFYDGFLDRIDCRFYMVDSRLLFTVFVVSARVSTKDRTQEDHGFSCPKA
jgi:hypothetical protein